MNNDTSRNRFSGPDLNTFADTAHNPREALDAAELGEFGDLTREEKALRFVLSLFVTGNVRTVTNRIVALRWLLGNDQRPLAALAAELGVSRPRMNQIRDSLALRLTAKGVRVRTREHLTNRGA